jgi:site-specific DNA-cytosine methylase
VSTRLRTLAEGRDAGARDAIRLALRHVGGAVTRAAKILDCSPSTVHREIDRLGMRVWLDGEYLREDRQPATGTTAPARPRRKPGGLSGAPVIAATVGRALDLCAGAGGLSLGLQRAGFDVRGVEVDEDACETHRANVGPCEQASIVGWHPPRRVDLVAGGVPCTDHSIAGKRAGTAGSTGALYRELVRIGVEADADALLLENVEGMLTTRDADGWTTVARVEDAMRAAGYEPRRAVLCAADYGTPQRRYRLIVVAFRDPRALAAFRWPEPTHAEHPGLLGLKPWVTVREALGLGNGAFRAGRRVGAKGWNGERYLDVDQPSTTVVGSHANADLLSPLDRPAATISAGGTATGGAEPFANAKYRRRLGDALALLDAPSCTITTVPDEGGDPERPARRPQVALREAIAAAGLLDRPATTIAGDPRERGAGHHEHARDTTSTRLSLAHRSLLQGFPPGFAWHGRTAGSKDRQCGNAVPPQLGEAVGRKVREALRAREERAV